MWLAKGKPAYLERERLLPKDAIDLAHASGAVAVLAHPTSLGFNGPAMERFIADLAADGLDGMECEYGRYSPDLRAALRRWPTGWASPSPAAVTTTAATSPTWPWARASETSTSPTTSSTRSKPAVPKPPAFLR